MKGISLIIPVYNEENSLEETIDRCFKMFSNVSFDNEIIIVNDGSTDRTSLILERIKEQNNIKIICNEKNKGYGASLKKGIKNALYEYIFISDCDGTYPIEKLPEFSEELLNGKCDMIVGARRGSNVAIPLVRRPAKKFIGMLANYLSGHKIPDVNSGFRGFKKEIAEKYFNILPDGFSFTTTITLAMLTNDYSVKYIDIEYFKRKGVSKIHPIRDTSNFIRLIIRTILYFDPLKIFLPVSGILFFAGIGTFLYSIFFMEKVFEDTTVILVMAAFQIFAIGLIADLIEKRMK
jgi:glycosyltransferase involved in cell wall biosynthesis